MGGQALVPFSYLLYYKIFSSSEQSKDLVMWYIQTFCALLRCPQPKRVSTHFFWTYSTQTIGIRHTYAGPISYYNILNSNFILYSLHMGQNNNEVRKFYSSFFLKIKSKWRETIDASSHFVHNVHKNKIVNAILWTYKTIPILWGG